MTNKSMDNFLHGDREGEMEANFEKKIFKLYKFGEGKAVNQESDVLGDSLPQDDDLHMNEKIIYSLKDLILLNQNKNKLMYFEIVEEPMSSKSKLLLEPESENISMSKYASSSQLKDQNLIVVEIKFQAIKF